MTVRTPTVLFVCSGNAGKSQMAAAAARLVAGDAMTALSAGTAPKAAVNPLSAAVMAEIGADLTGEVPKAVDPAVLADADRVVVLGSQARVEPVEGMRAPKIETWEVDEPADRGIEGEHRMRLVRDDIVARVRTLVADLRK